MYRNKSAFTLLEVVIVVLIIGIIAVMAIPALIDTSDEARESALRGNLRVVRHAIDMYLAEHGAYPGQDEDDSLFKAELKPYLHRFPANPLNESDKADAVKFISSGTLSASVDGNEGWLYDTRTGDFVANTSGTALEVSKSLSEL